MTSNSKHYIVAIYLTVVLPSFCRVAAMKMRGVEVFIREVTADEWRVT